jgi:protein gp37
LSLGTTIEWTDATWNPVRGCSKISPGCKNCYAERFAERFRGVPGHPFEQGFDVRFVPEKIPEPLLWKSPRKIFVNSMSDLFHESIPDSYILQIAQVMREANWHIYQILTKRHDRMAKLLSGPLSSFAAESHIWWGVSVENRKHGLPRLRKLQKTQIAVRFLSIEPLLEDLGEIDLNGIAWVIVGGESGPGARPMQPAWVRSIQNQCSRDGVPFFFKQWGGTRKKASGRTLDGRTYNNFPKIIPSISTSISGKATSPFPSIAFVPVEALAGS